MKKYAIVLLVLTLILVIAFTFLRQSAGAQDVGQSEQPIQHRILLFVPKLLDECTAPYDCAVVEPTPANPCDNDPTWPYCP